MSAPATLSDIPSARSAILRRLAEAAKRSGRAADAVTLVAVSKKQPDERIDAMLATGQRVFGENRVQEAQARWSDRKKQLSDLELRLIGPLQTNKAEDAVALFDVIETVDRPKLAGRIAAAMDKLDRRPRLYVQVNTGEEDQKSGIAPDQTAAFVNQCQSEFGLEIEGLMCIPPLDEPASLHFALLAKLAAEAGVEKLSMGMSGDFELAAELGATSVRVGSALFGARPAPV
jgi:pyridoxal phosphate enzyme (YggS family)